MSVKDRLHKAMTAFRAEVTIPFSDLRWRPFEDSATDLADAVDAMIAAAVAAEREACAVICDRAAPNTAAAIRARGEAAK